MKLMKDKRGFVQLAAMPIGTIIVGAILIAIIVGGLLMFTSINKFYVIGGGFLVLTFIYGIKPALSGDFTREKLVFLVLLLMVGVVILLIPMFSDFNQNFIVDDSVGAKGEEVLDFCSTQQECIDFMKEQGMPNNFLEQNGITITCENGICKAKK